MDKVNLKATLILAQQETLRRLRDEYAGYQSGGNLDLEDVRDADDHSHREQTEEYLYALERQIRQKERDMETLRDLDFSRKESVEAGAVALVNGQYYIIGIPACRFDLEGKHFVAMSPEAPFYQALMDRKEHDSFVFNDRTFVVESIF